MAATFSNYISRCNYNSIAICQHHAFRGFAPTLDAKSMAANWQCSGLDQLDDHRSLLFRPIHSVSRICHYLCSSALASCGIGRIGPHATANRSNIPRAIKTEPNLGHYLALRLGNRDYASDSRPTATHANRANHTVFQLSADFFGKDSRTGDRKLPSNRRVYRRKTRGRHICPYPRIIIKQSGIHHPLI